MLLHAPTLKHHIPIPIQPEPLHAFENGPRGIVRATRLVRIFDTKQELTAHLPSEQPVKQRGACSPNVQVARRGRSKSNPNHLVFLVKGVVPTIRHIVFSRISTRPQANQAIPSSYPHPGWFGSTLL